MTTPTKASEFFFELTPERVLDLVESIGLIVTGRCSALNSFENRVYEIELESVDKVVAKFYRPGRWTKEQILEEHQFIADLVENEVPVVAPLKLNAQGETLVKLPKTEIWATVFPKVGGRASEELQSEQVEILGRLLARMHAVGRQRESQHRIELNATTYGRKNLEALKSGNWIPLDCLARYEQAVLRVCEQYERFLKEDGITIDLKSRLHGDCHPGNLLWNQQGPFFLDFDDMVKGPAVQDLWLLIPGRDEDSLQRRNQLVRAYQEMADFNVKSLNLIEPLRALRIIHFSAWIAKRWEDPAFPQAFPNYGTASYWREEVQSLEEIVGLFSS